MPELGMKKTYSMKRANLGRKIGGYRPAASWEQPPVAGPPPPLPGDASARNHCWLVNIFKTRFQKNQHFFLLRGDFSFHPLTSQSIVAPGHPRRPPPRRGRIPSTTIGAPQVSIAPHPCPSAHAPGRPRPVVRPAARRPGFIVFFVR